MLRGCLITLALGVFVCPAGAYFVEWDGTCLPEDAGWTHQWGDWNGLYHGTGAVRTIQDGVMTMDSLYDPGVYDIALMQRPFNPAPGEMFVMEWRLAVDQVVGPGDPGVCLNSDDGWLVSFKYDGGRVFSLFDPGLNVPVSPGEFHDYRMVSENMRNYEFFVDGELSYEGDFWYGGPGSWSTMGWGDYSQGVASLSRWDYVRVYTTPEPSCLALCGALVLVAAPRRRKS
jgi:hypothetical protein